MIEKSEIRKIANSANKQLRKENNNLWPDCYKVSQRIEDEIFKNFNVDSEQVSIQEFSINGRYGHYALEINYGIEGSSAVVDASYMQFSQEMDTTVSLAPKSELNHVVIAQPKDSYIFYNYKKSY